MKLLIISIPSIVLTVLVAAFQAQGAELDRRGVFASFRDNFTGEQGFLGWHYGFCEPGESYDPEVDFVPFDEFDELIVDEGAPRHFFKSNDWVSVHGSGVHPGGVIGSQQQPPHDGIDRSAIIRWVAPISAAFELAFDFSKPGSSSDGVSVDIYIDGTNPFSTILPAGESTDWGISKFIEAGTTIDVVIGKNENSSGDYTDVSFVVSGLTPDTDIFDLPFGDQGYVNETGTATYAITEGAPLSATNDIYGVGHRSPPIREAERAESRWVNLSDVGNYERDLQGVHAGEDWNFYASKDNAGHFNGNDDIGLPLYPTAIGKVVYIGNPFYHGNPDDYGYQVIVRHWIAGTADVYDSIYLHVAPRDFGFLENSMGHTPEDNPVAEHASNGARFPFRVGQIICRDADTGRLPRFAALAGISGPHLHFELRDRPIPDANLVFPWMSSNNVYYSYNNARGDMTVLSPADVESQMNDIYSRMAADGIVDPTDFINDSRGKFASPPVGTLSSNTATLNRIREFSESSSRLKKKLRKAKSQQTKKRLRKKIARFRRAINSYRLQIL